MSWLWLLRKGFGGSVAVLDDLEQVLYVFVTQINFDGNHLEVAEASDLRGWAFDPCRSPRGFPKTQHVLFPVLRQNHQKLICHRPGPLSPLQCKQ